ncbi:vWA domain-containing protein [Salisaeta longa]|uniref:vWA domain-containing protein n=1 Tax=Salisaeta longa TaxID=503170 RepID=UPI00040A5D98|nr:BatA and WFA domain-containing protein [Salisaeta longa]
MTFLNPLALLALAAVGVPLVLHLLNLRKPQRVDFSSLAFVEALKETAVQRVRVKRWILLALRMLAIACLVLAFARPTVERAWMGTAAPTARTAHALVVDNSMSMGRTAPTGGTLLDQARAAANGVLGAATTDDVVALQPTAATEATAIGRTASLDRVRAGLERLEPLAGAASLAERMTTAARALTDAPLPRRVVYGISDGQATQLGDSLQQPWPAGVQPVLLPLPSAATANVAVTGVRIVSRIIERGQPVTIEATLMNHGPQTVRDVVASAYLADARVAQATATLPPNDSTTVTFTATPSRRGWLRGRIAIDADPFTADNERFFTLHVPRMRRVLLVRGQGTDAMRYVSLALARPLTNERIGFRTTTIAESALSATALGRYDAVVLVGPRDLSSGEVQALARYVRNGGGLLFFPNAQAQPADYTALLQALGQGRVVGFSGALGGRASVASFANVALKHPLFEGVFASRRGGVRVESPALYYLLNMRFGGGQQQALITLSNGYPLLTDMRHGTGRALFMAAAPAPRWTDLPLRGLFVPLLYRSVFYLSSGGRAASPALIAGRTGELRLPGVPPDAVVRLVGPAGREWRPSQRRAFGATVLSVGANLHTTGWYDVRTADSLVQRVAVNLAPEESNLRALAPDSIAQHLSAVFGQSVQVVAPENLQAATVTSALRASQTGTEIWNVFLLLALLCLVAEMLLVRYWTPEEAAA